MKKSKKWAALLLLLLTGCGVTAPGTEPEIPAPENILSPTPEPVEAADTPPAFTPKPEVAPSERMTELEAALRQRLEAEPGSWAGFPDDQSDGEGRRRRRGGEHPQRHDPVIDTAIHQRRDRK